MPSSAARLLGDGRGRQPGLGQEGADRLHAGVAHAALPFRPSLPPAFTGLETQHLGRIGDPIGPPDGRPPASGKDRAADVSVGAGGG